MGCNEFPMLLIPKSIFSSSHRLCESFLPFSAISPSLMGPKQEGSIFGDW